MSKAELIERIIDALIDPWTDCPDDYLFAELIDLDEANDVLSDLRWNDEQADLEPEERLPEEVTASLVMEAYNCLIRARKHEARVNRLAGYITNNEMVCEYANYYFPEHDDAIYIVPVDFIWHGFPFDLVDDLSKDNPFWLIIIGRNSANTFNPNHEFCWFDKVHMVLHSTNCPFGDGVLDADAFAEYIMSDEGQDCFDYITNDIMDDDEFQAVFGCTREAFANE